MKKTNLLKAVVCAIMITLVMTSTVLAGTASEEIFVRNVAAYTKNYSGAVGDYTLTGTSSSVRTIAANTSTGDKYFQCFVYRYNFTTETYDYQDVDSGVLANGERMSVEIGRDMNNGLYDYEHVARGYSTPTYISGALVDEYKLKAMQ